MNSLNAQGQTGFIARVEARAGKKMPVPGIDYSSEEHAVAVEITMQVRDYAELRTQMRAVQDLAEACVDERFERRASLVPQAPTTPPTYVYPRQAGPA